MDYVESDGLHARIEDKELMGMAAGSVAGCAAHPDTVLSIGVDNINAVSWVLRGKSRWEFAMELLSAFLMWRAHQWIEVVIFYLRTNHNVKADEVTRMEDKDLPGWGDRKGLARTDLPELWRI